MSTVAYEELKQKQSVIWGTGPYQRVTETITDIHEAVVDRIDPSPGERWLDLACGTGAVAERAAARAARVTGVDLAPALIETARERATKLGLEIEYQVGDCERLDLQDGLLRRRVVGLRDHVRARPRRDRPRARPRCQARRAHRPCQLDAGPARCQGAVHGDGALPARAAAVQPIRLGRRRACAGAAGGHVRIDVRDGRVGATAALGRGLLGAVLDQLRPDQDRWRTRSASAARSSTGPGWHSSRTAATSRTAG